MKDLSGMRRCNKVSIWKVMLGCGVAPILCGVILIWYLVTHTVADDGKVLLVLMGIALIVVGCFSAIEILCARSRYWSARIGKPHTMKVYRVCEDPDIVVKGRTYSRVVCRDSDGVEYLSGTLLPERAEKYRDKEVTVYINRRKNAYCVQVPAVYSY